MGETVIGNVYDKYGASNPMARRLMSRFLSAAESLLAPLEAESIVEAGCGEGHFAQLVSEWKPGAEIFCFDISQRIFDAGHVRHPRLHFSLQSAYAPAFPSRRFDLVLAMEVLEHLEDPERAMRELSRLASSHVLASVPREPIWRLLNMARLAYLRDWGNTPGHLQHWSSRAFVSLVSRYFEPVAVAKPLPWTMVLARKRNGR